MASPHETLAFFADIIYNRKLEPAAIDWQSALKDECGIFLYYRLGKSIPEQWYDKCKNKYVKQSIVDMIQRELCRELRQLFNDSGIDFCFLKGAYLAENIYPQSTLRESCDIDVLLRSPEECQRAWQLLKSKGWTSPFTESTLEEKQHHVQVIVKNHVCVELHYRLFRHTSMETMERFWHETLIKTSQGNEYVMPNELNLMFLLVHEVFHDWHRRFRFFCDCGLLASQPGFDYDKCLEFAKILNIQNPKLFFYAFPEIFMDANDSRIPKEAMALRDYVFENREYFFGRDSLNADDFLTPSWIWYHIRMHSPSWMKVKYNAHNAGFFKLCSIYFREMKDILKVIFSGRKNMQMAVDAKQNFKKASGLLGIDFTEED